jgi:hypothetical protein
MTEEETREPYEKPELTKLDNIKELSGETCWTCQGSFSF